MCHATDRINKPNNTYLSLLFIPVFSSEYIVLRPLTFDMLQKAILTFNDFLSQASQSGKVKSSHYSIGANHYQKGSFGKTCTRLYMF